MVKEITRGSIFMAELPMKNGSSVQGGIRPVLVVQNDRRKLICADGADNPSYVSN